MRLKAWFVSLSLGGKLLFANLLTIGTISFFAALTLIVYLWGAQRADLMRNAEVTARVLAQNSAPAFLFDDAKVAAEVIGALARDRDVIGAELFHPDGRSFASYRRVGSGKMILLPADASPGGAAPMASHFHWRHVDVVADVDAAGQNVGYLLVRVDLAPTYYRLGRLAAVMLIAGLGAILIAGWLLPRLLRLILGPVAQLVAVMRAVSRNEDYSQRAPVQTGDEIGALGESFNIMIEQIQRRDKALGKELAERKRAELQLDHIAHYDGVTGLPNRHFFNRRVDEIMRINCTHQASYGLMFVDLDDFKYVNDTFGHPVGDTLLHAVAERLQQVLRANDLVVRLGGDEFAVVLDRPKSVDDAMRLAGKILAAMAAPFTCVGHEFSVGASIGVAMMPQHVRDFSELLSCADAAMYRAKALGKNNAQLWKPEMSARTARRFRIEAGLRKAIENGELAVYYQPIIDLASRQIVGMEALLRWQHPLLGFVSPVEFIPVAEESRLIITIGDWVLRQACAQIQRWVPRFGPLFVAVNVSTRQFRDPGFADCVQRIVGETGCPPDLLELEVTETVIMEQTAETLAILVDLAGRGFRLSLDDFGTGYSSLAYLKRFPLSKLKIDRSFVSDLPDDVDDVVIARTIVALAQNLGMQVVAEGVETEAQADFLRNLGCTYGQGYLFSRPLSAEHFATFAEEALGPRLRVVGPA